MIPAIEKKIMSRRNRLTPIQDLNQPEEADLDIAAEETVQNNPPVLQWSSFDSFWSDCVKNGTPAVKNACEAHFKTLGVWDNQDEWIKAAQHFGIPLEK